jgi:glycosyltransferase involved in cell wall biosynthesis
VLASLRGQTLPAEQWEFLLVDNASRQPLEEIWDISWHSRGRHIREVKLGLTHARLRGIEESSGELLIFVDDDNLLAKDFLQRAATISAQFPVLGAFGSGKLEPEFEVQPPPELRSNFNLLALRSVPSALWTNNVRDAQCKPWGAGLCITRHVANFYRRFVPELGITAVLDRRGQLLFSGGDDVFSRVAAQVGLHFGVFPELQITHLVPAGRLNQDHLLRLIHGHSLSHGVLDYVLDGTCPQRTDLVRLVQLLLHGMMNGLFSMRRQWAALRGAADAAKFISANCLRPAITTESRERLAPSGLQHDPAIRTLSKLTETGLKSDGFRQHL